MCLKQWDLGYQDLLDLSQLPTLENRRLYLKLCTLYKIIHGYFYFPSNVFVPQVNRHSRWASGPDNWILTSVAEVHGVWNLATNHHGAYFLSFLQTSSLLQAPIQAGLAQDCVEETFYFTNIYFS